MECAGSYGSNGSKGSLECEYIAINVSKGPRGSIASKGSQGI